MSKEVSRVSKEVSRKFQGCFESILGVFQGSFNGLSRKFQGGFKGSYMDVS